MRFKTIEAFLHFLEAPTNVLRSDQQPNAWFIFSPLYNTLSVNPKTSWTPYCLGTFLKNAGKMDGTCGWKANHSEKVLKCTTFSLPPPPSRVTLECVPDPSSFKTVVRECQTLI